MTSRAISLRINGVAHEVNNPAALVTLNLGMVRDRLQRGDPRVEESLEIVHTTVEHVVVAAAGHRILFALGLVGEPGVQLGLAAVGQVRKATGERSVTDLGSGTAGRSSRS